MASPDVEILVGGKQSLTARTLLKALSRGARDAGLCPMETMDYTGRAPWLALWGVGRAHHLEARARHLAAGGRVIMWDMGYVGRGKYDAYCRVSIDDVHPWRWLDRTPPDPSRWDAFGIALREDADPAGHVILAGMGPKSHAMLECFDWEAFELERLRGRFPGVEIRYRPKPRREVLALGVPPDTRPIEKSLRGAQLLVCRHSNCALDAAIAGVPFECEDGAAYWLMGKPFTVANRLDLLRRVCWWQWTCYEMPAAWRFLKEMLCD